MNVSAYKAIMSTTRKPSVYFGSAICSAKVNSTIQNASTKSNTPVKRRIMPLCFCLQVSNFLKWIPLQTKNSIMTSGNTNIKL